MVSQAEEIWRSGDKEAIWHQFCGFLKLDVGQVMQIQEKGLLAQLKLLAGCELGRRMLGGKVPRNVEEFRHQVRLTTYADYEPYFDRKLEDALPVGPFIWVCTSGTGGKTKWVPYSPDLYERAIDWMLTFFILSTSDGQGKFSLAPGDVILYGVAPPPYVSGIGFEQVARRFGFRFVPPAEEAVRTKDIQARWGKGFQMGLSSGIDILPGLPSILAKMGEHFSKRGGKPPIGMLVNPRVILRMLRATRKAKREERLLLPKDIWQFKSIMVGGMDLEAFRDRIVEYWGREPYETYVNTEFGGLVALPTWTRKGMTFVDDIAFLEFIPEEESLASLADPDLEPSTLLLSELSSGERYELVFTSLRGGAFVRYRPGDMIRVVALQDDETGVELPQIAVEGRADKLIDIGGFTRLNERILWQAIEDAGLEYEGWMARKEFEDGEPVLRLYIALRGLPSEPARLEELLHQSLKKFDSSYKDLEEMTGLKPLRVVTLPFGVFEKYARERIAAGADPAFIKEQTMQPSDETVDRILKLAM